MKKPNKGEYGYLKHYKLSKLMIIMLLAVMLAAVVIGTLIMFGDTSRVIIVFAILLSLPLAKYISQLTYVLLLPFILL